MNKHRPFKPRIKLVGGQWYAFAPNRSHMSMGYLVPAISFVRARNAKEGRSNG